MFLTLFGSIFDNIGSQIRSTNIFLFNTIIFYENNNFATLISKFCINVNFSAEMVGMEMMSKEERVFLPYFERATITDNCNLREKIISIEK